MPQIALPKIEVDPPRTFRITLKGRLAQDLEDYRAAYQATYETAVELDALIGQILDAYIQSDRSFRTWRAARRDSADRAPQR